MDAGVERRPRPRVIIPPKQDQDDYNAYSGSLSPPTSGNLSPDLQPSTPPVLSPDENPGQIFQIGKYLLVEHIDSNVYKAMDTNNGQENICKVFDMDSYRVKIEAYCRLHEDTNVMEIKEIIKGDKKVYVFFNRHYGDLHSYVRSKKRLKEEEAITIFKQIARAVSQCHMCGVVIRDLKLRKFVFVNPEKTKVKLEGLEDSYVMSDSNDDDTLRDKQGCPAYVSPEVLGDAKAGYSGKASDQWGSGVMLYTMLVGRYPFYETELSKMFEKIRIGNFTIPNTVTPKARCLIKNLLRKEASERLTADEVLQHPWLKSSTSVRITSKDYMNDHLVPIL